MYHFKLKTFKSKPLKRGCFRCQLHSNTSKLCLFLKCIVVFYNGATILKNYFNFKINIDS